MDYLLTAITLYIIAVLLGVAIYLLMIRIFKTEKTDMFVIALLGLVISDFMIVFLAVLCTFKATGMI